MEHGQLLQRGNEVQVDWVYWRQAFLLFLLSSDRAMLELSCELLRPVRPKEAEESVLHTERNDSYNTTRAHLVEMSDVSIIEHRTFRSTSSSRRSLIEVSIILDLSSSIRRVSLSKR